MDSSVYVALAGFCFSMPAAQHNGIMRTLPDRAVNLPNLCMFDNGILGGYRGGLPQHIGARSAVSRLLGRASAVIDKCLSAGAGVPLPCIFGFQGVSAVYFRYSGQFGRIVRRGGLLAVLSSFFVIFDYISKA